MAEPEVVLGDVNGDGSLSISDAVVLIDFLLNSSGQANGEKFNIDGADVNGDGRVSILDVTILIDILLESTH